MSVVKQKPLDEKRNKFDVVVAGGGLSGLTLSCLLAGRGVKTACVDRDDPARVLDAGFDGRTMAVSYGSRRVLEAAGLWADIEADACPIREIRILDAGSPVLLDFKSEEAEGRTFGWIVDIRLLRKALFARAAALKNLTHLAPAAVTDFGAEQDQGIPVRLDTGETLSAALLVGADGRRSFTREHLDIPVREWPYRQRAVVCAVTHENPHGNIAVEHFRPEGPFAILPMTDGAQGRHRSSVVWTEDEKSRESVLSWDEETFNAALNARFPPDYGRVRLLGQRWAYPLGLVHAYRYTGERTALVADAAHGIHPIAGQGLNLGLRDVAALAELVFEAKDRGEDIGSPVLLERYQRMRRFDNMAMAGATDLLNRAFASDFPPLRLARRAGLRAVARLPAAKRFFMEQAMGVSGILPSLIRED